MGFNRDVAIDEINRRRAARRWTIPDLAEHSRVSVSMLTKMLCGRRACSLTTATAVADALDCTVDDITRPRQGRTPNVA